MGQFTTGPAASEEDAVPFHNHLPNRGTGREYPARPIVAVGGLVFRGRSAVLVKRGKQPGLGQWSIPGGALHVGESLSDGVIREIREETGLDVRVGPLVEMVERIVPDEEGRIQYHYIILDYLCFSSSGEPAPSSDAADARLVPPEEWPDYDLPGITMRVLDKALKMAEDLQPGPAV